MTNKNKTTTDIFANLIGGPDLYVNDWMDIFDHIIDHGQSIKGVAEYLLYARFIHEKSAGRINRPQWHSSKTITEYLKIDERSLRRFEQHWTEHGWLLKIADQNHGPSMRTLGHQFDHIRTQWVNWANLCEAKRNQRNQWLTDYMEHEEKSELIRELSNVPFQKLRLLTKS